MSKQKEQTECGKLKVMHDLTNIKEEIQTNWTRKVVLHGDEIWINHDNSVLYHGFDLMKTSIPIGDVTSAITDAVVEGKEIPLIVLAYDEDVFQLWRCIDKDGVQELRTYFKNHHPQIRGLITCEPIDTYIW